MSNRLPTVTFFSHMPHMLFWMQPAVRGEVDQSSDSGSLPVPYNSLVSEVSGNGIAFSLNHSDFGPGRGAGATGDGRLPKIALAILPQSVLCFTCILVWEDAHN